MNFIENAQNILTELNKHNSDREQIYNHCVQERLSQAYKSLAHDIITSQTYLIYKNPLKVLKQFKQ